MRGIAAVAGFLLLLTAGPAAAQSAAELQALGQQAAQKYGVPWDLFRQQIQAESGWTNAGCNAKNACGIAQFIPGTAKQFGIDPQDPAQALDAAAKYDAQLYQQKGSWTGALTGYTGGLTPSSPGNNAYATAFQLAAAADNGTLTGSLAGGLGGGTITLGDGSITSVGPDGSTLSTTTAKGSTGTLSESAKPFALMYKQLTDAIQLNLLPTIQRIQTLSWHYVQGIVTLLIMIRAAQVMLGRLDVMAFFADVVRISIVVPLVSPASGLFTGKVVAFVQDFPGMLASSLGGDTSGTSAASFLDQVYLSLNADISAMWAAAGWNLGEAALAACYTLGTLLLAGPSLLAIFWTFALTNFTLALMLCIGPIPLLISLIPAMRGMLQGWIEVMVTLLGTVLVIDVVLIWYQGIMKVLVMSHTPSSGANPHLDGPGLLGVAFGLVMLGASTLYLPRLVGRIAGGVSVGMSTMGYWIGAGPAQDAARAPVAAGRRWLGLKG
jgi:hypothetical protein